MVHTGEFLVMLDEFNEDEAKEVLDEKNIYKSKGAIVVHRSTRVGNRKINRLHIFVDFIEILGRPNIIPGDCEEIENRVRNIVGKILKCNNFRLILSRIDYRYDVVIEDKVKRELIIKLLKKSYRKVNYMRKIDKYKDSIRFFAKSRSDNFYDKEKERKAKNKETKEYEKNIIRFEAQIKNEHLRYKKRKNKISRYLEEYLTYDMYEQYMNKMIINIIGKGDFYSLEEAQKIINQSNIKEKKKNQLREFLAYTSKGNLTKTKEKYGRYTFNKNISILEELGINPIIIPDKNGVRKTGIKFIENPLKNLIQKLEVYN